MSKNRPPNSEELKARLIRDMVRLGVSESSAINHVEVLWAREYNPEPIDVPRPSNGPIESVMPTLAECTQALWHSELPNGMTVHEAQAVVSSVRSVVSATERLHETVYRYNQRKRR